MLLKKIIKSARFIAALGLSVDSTVWNSLKTLL